MCGLVYKHNAKPSYRIKKEVWKQYKRQTHRGTEGFGIFDGKHVVKAATEKRIERWFKRDGKTNMLLFHHRMPTSTENTRKGAHPYHTGDYFGDTRYVLAHNGCIRNPKELKAEHDKLGITYVSTMPDGSFNDSEALLWDFALTQEGKQDKMKAYGDMAIICIKMVGGEPEKLLFGRNWARPLNLHRQNKSMTLSSEGTGEKVPENTLHTYDYATGELSTEKMVFASYAPYSYDSSYNYRGSSYNYGFNRTYQIPSHSAGSETYYDDWYMDDNGYLVYDEDDYIEEGLSNVRNNPITNTDWLTEPSDLEIEREFYNAMNAADGKYMDAYWMIQAEIYLLEQETDLSMSDEITLKTMKAALQKIVDDPDYAYHDSIHPLWEEDFDENMKLELVTKGA